MNRTLQSAGQINMEQWSIETMYNSESRSRSRSGSLAVGFTFTERSTEMILCHIVTAGTVGRVLLFGEFDDAFGFGAGCRPDFGILVRLGFALPSSFVLDDFGRVGGAGLAS